MQKKFLSMVTALVMIISLLPQGIITVSAATIAATQPSTDENGVYQIGTAAELYWFAEQVNGGTTDINAVLTANITVNTGVLTDKGTINASNMENFISWTPIGNSSNNYTGTFDGQGYTVSGLYFNKTSAYNVGLFGCVSSNETNKGSVSNVGVVDSYFNGYVRVGGVCGENYGTITDCYSTGTVSGTINVGGMCGENYGTITDCYNTGTTNGSSYVGGVCGYNVGDTIENCYNTGTVSGSDVVGGVCGSTGDNRIITNCYNTGTVSGNENVGGVCGENHGTIAVCYNTGTINGSNRVGGVGGFNAGIATITSCYNTGSVTATGDSAYAGGVGGFNSLQSTITNCYNTGSVAVTGNSVNAGGVCGRTSPESTITNCYNAGSVTVTGDSAYAGGVCGFNSVSSTITNCYNAGSVTVTGDSAYVGGMCGYNSNGNITNCYFDSNKCNANAIGKNESTAVTNVEGKTTDKFTSGEVAYLLQSGQEADENGNIPEVWGQDLNTANTYPVLGGAKVYQVVAYAGCESNPGDESTGYSNTNAPVYGDHSYDSNGFCECGDSLYQPAEWDETNNRYEISNAGQLYWFADKVNNDNATYGSANAILTKDIVVNMGVLKSDGTLADDTSDFISWTPIGDSANAYTGTFDGDDKTISGLYFSETETSYVGLFGKNSGTVKNVGVVDSYFSGNENVGGVCGCNYAWNNKPVIQNCYNKSTVSGSSRVGGVCGYNYACGNESVIQNCYNTGTVSGSNYVGGVYGWSHAVIGTSTIENCYNTGTVSGSSYVGGVCGENTVNNVTIGTTIIPIGTIIIQNCYYLSDTATGGINGADDTDSKVVGKTANQFTSGEVAYLLQGEQTEAVWGQTIGKESYPVLGGAKVYQVVAYAGCEGYPGDESTGYSNTNAPVYGAHSVDSNGFCEYGDGGYQPAEWDETNNRYEISNAGQLYWFAEYVNSGNIYANAVLTADITVNSDLLDSLEYNDDGSVTNGDSFKAWTPIGYYNNDNDYIIYYGTFDGAGHTISGLYFDDTKSSYVGLFGYADSNGISNVGIVDSYFKGDNHVGGVCGFNYGTITNCYSDSNKCNANAVAENEEGTVTNVEGKTTDKFTSGEVAYLLQSGQEADENGIIPEVWGQDLSSADSYPVLTSDIAKKVCKVEFKTLGADSEYTLYTERYGNYDNTISDFPKEITDTIWVDGVDQFTASSRVTGDKTVYPVGYSVKYNNDGKVMISAPKMGNYIIMIASYSCENLLRAKSADIQINNWYESYEITGLNGFDTTGADTVKVFFWDTKMKPQCDITTKTLP